jgi:hypothetical protein
MVDMLYLGAVFPKRTSIMAKRQLKYSPILGQYSECLCSRTYAHKQWLCLALSLSTALEAVRMRSKLSPRRGLT